MDKNYKEHLLEHRRNLESLQQDIRKKKLDPLREQNAKLEKLIRSTNSLLAVFQFIVKEDMDKRYKEHLLEHRRNLESLQQDIRKNLDPLREQNAKLEKLIRSTNSLLAKANVSSYQRHTAQSIDDLDGRCQTCGYREIDRDHDEVLCKRTGEWKGSSETCPEWTPESQPTQCTITRCILSIGKANNEVCTHHFNRRISSKDLLYNEDGSYSGQVRCLSCGHAYTVWKEGFMGHHCPSCLSKVAFDHQGSLYYVSSRITQDRGIIIDDSQPSDDFNNPS